MKIRAIALFVVWAGLAAIIGSCADNVSPVGNNSADSLWTTTSQVAVTLRAGSDSVNQLISVNGSQSGISWSAASSASWLRISQTSGATPAVVGVMARSDGLPAGEHTATITILSPAISTPVVITVHLSVVAQVTLVAAPGTLTFAGTRGDTLLGPQQISVSGSGGTLQQWSAASADSWISLTPPSGSGNGAVTVRVRPGTLAAGTYTGNITITAAGATGSPVTIPVTLTLAARTFAVSATANPGNGGSVSGAGTYNEGATATLQATAANGFEFTNWTESGAVVSTSTSYSFVVSSARSLVANFRQRTVNITTSANPSAGGTTSGGGNVVAGSNTTVMATPNTGYVFANWTENGVIVSSAQNYTFVATTDRALVANFGTQTFTITTSSNPVAGGSTTGGGMVVAGASVTVRATPAANYAFTNWTENGAVASTAANYTFVADHDRSLVANFAPPADVLVEVSTNPPSGNSGNASGGGTYPLGATVTVTAVPRIGYIFDHWEEIGGPTVSTDSVYVFTATKQVALVAVFKTANYPVTTIADPTGGGTTFCQCNRNERGDRMTVIATPTAGWSFVNWTENGSVVSTLATYDFILAGARTLTAHFVTNANVLISTTSNPAAGGTTAGGGSVPSGSSVTVVATAASNYAFANWTESGNIVATSASYTFTANANRNLVANFTATSFTITTSSNPVAGGSTSGGGTVAPSSSVNVIATPANGYAFTNWTESGNIVSTSASYTFSATANRNLVANFTATNATITTTSNPIAGGSTSGGGTVTTGSNVTVTAIPASGYAFANWTENGNQVSTSASYTFIATTNRSLVANFSQNVTITVTSSNPAVATVSGGGVYTVGTSVTVRTTRIGPAIFAGWYEGGTQVSTASNYTFSATANRELLALYTDSATITTASSPSNAGTITGGGKYLYGATAHLTAISNPGYAFMFWSLVGPNSPTSGVDPWDFGPIDANYTVTAYFDTQVKVAIALNSAHGTATGAGTYAIGAPVTVSASAKPGFVFSNWTEGTNGVVSSSPSYSFTADRYRYLTANFISQ